MYNILVIVLVLVSIALITLILLQHGKGADAGAAFGSGASGTVFGARGSATFLSRVTAGLTVAFFAITLTLAYLSTHRQTPNASVVNQFQSTKSSGAGMGAPSSTASTAPATLSPGKVPVTQKKSGSKKAESKAAKSPGGG